MKDNGKIEIILSWEERNACCVFKRGGESIGWHDMTDEEQRKSVGVMVNMAELFGGCIKAKEVTK